MACGEAASDAPAVPGRLCGAVAAPKPATDYAAVSVDEPGDALCKVAAILCTSQKKLGIITGSDPYGSQC